MMEKDKFVEILRANGYHADVTDDVVTVVVIGGANEELWQTFLNCKTLAQQFGYGDSFRVSAMEEVHETY